MNCEILDIVYLRANGEMPCNCDLGEAINLDWVVNDDGWNIVDAFANERYEHIRKSFRQETPPWKERCEGCAFFQRDQPVRNALVNEKRITKFHVEPSLACALRCPGCSRAKQAAERTGPTFLRLDLFDRALRQLKAADFTIEKFFFCGQGEPLNHPEIHLLFDACRQHFPTTPIIVNTNGNHDYQQVTRGRFVDRYIVSVDGFLQGSYEQYRIHGKVEQALRFMEDAKRLPQGAVPYVEWKYILFVYNDGDEELLAAQQKAEAMGIDSLWFVLTFTPERSRRYTMANFSELPIISPLAYIYSVPQKDREYRSLKPTDSTSLESRRDLAALGWKGVIDGCKIAGNQLFLDGWAKPPENCALARVEVYQGDVMLGTALRGVPRPDVASSLPLAERGQNFGFRYLGPLVNAEASQLEIGVHFELETGERKVFCLVYQVQEPSSA